MPEPTIVDLLRVARDGVERGGADGAVWSLPHGGDLDANLVQLAPGGGVGEHVNSEVDVLVVGVAGSGTVVVDGASYPLRSGIVLALPKGARRRVDADRGESISYLTVHRARAGLGISGPPGR